MKTKIFTLLFALTAVLAGCSKSEGGGDDITPASIAKNYKGTTLKLKINNIDKTGAAQVDVKASGANTVDVVVYEAFDGNPTVTIPGLAFTVEQGKTMRYGAFAGSVDNAQLNANLTVDGTVQNGILRINIKMKAIEEEVPTGPRTELAKADPITVKVAVVVEDPVVKDGKRLHEFLGGWKDPIQHYKNVKDSLESASHGVVKYEIVNVYDDGTLWTYFTEDASKPDAEKYFTAERLYKYFVTEPAANNGQWVTIKEHEKNGTIKYDYVAMVDHFGFDEMRQNDEVNEIWVCSFSVNGMWESNFVAKTGGFWLNSSPTISSTLSNTKLLTVMYYNLERGIAEAIHSNGHRMESTMKHVYDDRWVTVNRTEYLKNQGVTLNNWEKYSTYDMVIPGKAYIGNIHFPANGIKDYDYDNATSVPCYRKAWKYYPDIRMLEEDKEMVNKNNWAAMGGGDYQLGCMMNFFGHLPNKKGINPKDKKLNNWWYYMVKWEEANDAEKSGM